jgi:hypothetical protein
MSRDSLKFLESALLIGRMFAMSGRMVPRVTPRMIAAIDKS